MKYAAIVLGLVLVAALILWGSTLFKAHRAAGIHASGTIEATESDVASKVQGRLITLRVRDGAKVRAGDTIAVLEQLTPALSADQARANVSAAQAQVAAAQAAYDLQSSIYQTQLDQAGQGVQIAQANLGQAGETLGIETHAVSLRIDQAKAQLSSAQSAYARAKVELARSKALTATGDLPQRSLDDATAQYQAAAAQLQNARDAVALAHADERNVRIRELGVQSSRSQHLQSVAALQAARDQQQMVAQRHAQLLSAQAQLMQARAASGLAGDQLRETRLRAPFNGSIVSHNFEVGDLVAPGAAVMTIADLQHPYLYVYVNETDVPRIKTGMRADVTIDGMPDRTFTGTVTEIGSSAEFTPENVQTREQRIEYLVFRVKIQFTDTTGTLKPGLPADAVFHV